MKDKKEEILPLYKEVKAGQLNLILNKELSIQEGIELKQLLIKYMKH